ncbi:hypothetical protein HYC85_028512 [Camellia sinensis]|uniref:ABC transporter domain-containing protein n=1 Tax=Camellia sinensis TaxID=4442 RepID=A0A7J7FWK2_CAMSI|nr:hypothetical protein HYC85_028512 [Camellia sinensis]
MICDSGGGGGGGERRWSVLSFGRFVDRFGPTACMRFGKKFNSQPPTVRVAVDDKYNSISSVNAMLPNSDNADRSKFAKSKQQQQPKDLWSTTAKSQQQQLCQSSIEFVKEVLEIIKLDEIKDCLVGMPGVTEQRNWLTISVELVANPSIIFINEPTTGLDARAAAIVMRAVKNVAET